MPKTVYFDARYIRVDHHDGISRFSVGLIEALMPMVEVVAIISDHRQLDKLPSGIKHVFLNDPTSWLEVFAAMRLNKYRPQIVYSPMQTIGSMGRKFSLVLTLHDLIYYRHPKPPPSLPLAVRLGWRLYHLTYWPQRLVLNRADSVVTVSQTTKELMLNHRLTKRRIDVVYNAAGDLDSEYEHKPPAMRPRSIQNLVYMGSFMDYKNVETLIKGMSDLPGYRLNLLSSISQARLEELQSLVSPTGGEVVFHKGVSEAKYHEVLSSAVALVTASRDEGFGIPLVEAMVRGIPVVVSDIQIFKEIGGQAATYFETDSSTSFSDAVRSLENPVVWSEKSKLALVQSAQFNWTKSATSLVNALFQ